MQIKPLIEPTRLIMKVGVRNYEWHEIFPEGFTLILLIFYSSFVKYALKRTKGLFVFSFYSEE